MARTTPKQKPEVSSISTFIFYYFSFFDPSSAAAGVGLWPSR
jgi:hypothetical protein